MVVWCALSRKDDQKKNLRGKRYSMEVEIEPDQSESELSAYEGDVSLVESTASVEASESSESEAESSVSDKVQSSVGDSPSVTSPLSMFRSHEHGIRKPKSLNAGRTNLRKQIVHARLQAELIRAQSKIVQLESELSSQQILMEHSRIQQTDRHVTGMSEDVSGTQVERLHQVCSVPVQS